MKKILSLVLCLIMTVGVVPTYVCAEAKTKGSGNYTYKILDDGTAEIVKYKDNKTKVEVLKIPSELDGYKVTKIGDWAVNDYHALNSVEIPSGVTEIGNNAFYFNLSLETVSLPDGLKKIGANAFKECNLKEIIIPDSVTDIGFCAFEYCNLKSVKLSQSIKIIRKNTFRGCNNLKEVELPENLIKIGAGAFSGCAIKNLTIPNSVKTIEKHAFEYSDFEEIVIPESITEIKNAVFSNCEELKNVVLHQKLERIGSGAFSGCDSLKSIELPDSLKIIDSWAFSYCKNLINIKFPKGLEAIKNNAFKECSSLKKVKFLGDVSTIGNKAFYECVSLKKITIPKKTKIGKWALGFCEYFKKQKRKGVKIKIYGYKNSDAYRYAMDSGFDFINVKTKDRIKGKAPDNIGNLKLKQDVLIYEENRDLIVNPYVDVSWKKVKNAKWYIMEFSYSPNMKNSRKDVANKNYERIEYIDLGKTLYVRVKPINHKHGEFSKIFSIKLDKKGK